jgi:hypothetical protein
MDGFLIKSLFRSGTFMTGLSGPVSKAEIDDRRNSCPYPEVGIETDAGYALAHQSTGGTVNQMCLLVNLIVTTRVKEPLPEHGP